MTTERQFDDTQASVGGSRRFVASAAADADPAVLEAIVLMVSELATNAVVHASGGFTVRVERDGAGIRVTVTDGGSGRPVVRDPSDREPHGRGLRIVDELSDEWGTEITASQGKAVWFRIDTATGADGAVEVSRGDPSSRKIGGAPSAAGGDSGRNLRSSFRVAS